VKDGGLGKGCGIGVGGGWDGGILSQYEPIFILLHLLLGGHQLPRALARGSGLLFRLGFSPGVRTKCFLLHFIDILSVSYRYLLYILFFMV
jgi:hypothetical protein